MFCFECGNKCSDNAVFCGYCGAKIIKVPNQGPDKAVTENVSRSVSENAETFVPVFESEGVMESDGFTDVDLAEEEKRIEEEVRKEVRRRMEEEKRLREQKHLEEQKKREEQRRIEEQRRLEEQKRIEEQRRLEEQKRIEEQKRLEEQRRIEKEKRRKEIEEQKKNIQIKRVELDEKRKKLNEELNSLDSEEKELAAKERGLEHKLKEASENIHDDLDEQKSQDVFAAQHDSFSDDYWDDVDEKQTYSDVSDNAFFDNESYENFEENIDASYNRNNRSQINNEYKHYSEKNDKTDGYKIEKINTDNKSDGNTNDSGRNYNLIAYVVLLSVVFVFLIVLIVSKAISQNETKNVTTEAVTTTYTSLNGPEWSSLNNAVGYNDYYDYYIDGHAAIIRDEKMLDSFASGGVVEIVYKSNSKNMQLEIMKVGTNQVINIKPDRWEDVGGNYQRAFFSFEKVKECYGSDFAKDLSNNKVIVEIYNDKEYRLYSVWVGTYK